jgi:S-adenosylmethionine:tRNA ribosyltransferase-isomerase
VTALVARGTATAPVTLHAGVSSQEADEPPYPERYAVPESTARLVDAVRAAGGRVVAVGTTVVRPGDRRKARRDGPRRRRLEASRGHAAGGLRAVDGLLTGRHEPTATHLLVLEAVAGRVLVEASYRAAQRDGCPWHEFGDVHLIVP